MKIIDEERMTIVTEEGVEIDLYSPQGFKIISDLWLKVGWDQKHLYSFTWLGRPIIQLPDDMIRIQEVIYQVQPDVIIETGIAHGGSLIYYASILSAIDKGRVVGIDIEIREHNRIEIENHKLFELITLIEKSSTDDLTVRQLKKQIEDKETVLVILDAAHDYNHVMRELQLYSDLVTKDSYIVVTDGSQEFLGSTPRAKKDYPGYFENWEHNNPKKAAMDFVFENDQFEIVEPLFPFNEGKIDFRVTHWPSAYIKKNKS